MVPESCSPLSLSTGGGVSVLSGGCWETGKTRDRCRLLHDTRPFVCFPFPWPAALGAPSGARPPGLPLRFQQHLFHVPLLGGRGDLLLASVMAGAIEMDLNPRPWKWFTVEHQRNTHSITFTKDISTLDYNKDTSWFWFESTLIAQYNKDYTHGLTRPIALCPLLIYCCYNVFLFKQTGLFPLNLDIIIWTKPH